MELSAIALTRSSRGHQLGDERLPDRHLDGAGDAGHDRERVDVPDLDGAGEGEDEESRGLRHGDHVRDDQRPPPIQAIRQHAAERSDDHRRPEQERDDQAELEWRPAQVEDEPRQGNRLHPGADQAADLAEPEAAVVGVAHRNEAAGETRGRHAPWKAGDRHVLSNANKFRRSRSSARSVRKSRIRVAWIEHDCDHETSVAPGPRDPDEGASTRSHPPAPVSCPLRGPLPRARRAAGARVWHMRRSSRRSACAAFHAWRSRRRRSPSRGSRRSRHRAFSPRSTRPGRSPAPGRSPSRRSATGSCCGAAAADPDHGRTRRSSSAASRRPSSPPRSSSWCRPGSWTWNVRSVTCCLPTPGVPSAVTVRQLLDHTSGIADVYNPDHQRGPRGGAGSRAGPRETPVRDDPAAVASSRRRLVVCERELLPARPARRTRDRPSAGRRARATVLRAARSHLHRGAERGATGPLTAAWATVFWASGAMVSSAPDLARWGDALYGGDVLGARELEQMVAFNTSDYGLGAQRIEVAGRSGVGHTGLLDTYTSLLLHLPERAGDDRAPRRPATGAAADHADGEAGRAMGRRCSTSPSSGPERVPTAMVVPDADGVRPTALGSGQVRTRGRSWPAGGRNRRFPDA